MHKFLRAIGFSDIRERDLELILNEIVEHPSTMKVTRDSEDKEFAEFTKEFAKNIGITIRGSYDEEDVFQISYYVPFSIYDGISTQEQIDIEKHAEKESYAGVCDEVRLGVTLIFYLQNVADYLIEKDLTSSGNGLYKMEDVVTPGETLGMDEDGYDLSSNELMTGYIYRGENPDNYVKIGKTTFRIVKIDGNKDLTLVSTLNKPKSAYDDRYNNEIEKNYGINDYKVSRAYEKVADYFENKEKSDLIKEKVAAKNICIGARSEDETATDGSVECSVVMKDQIYGLLPLYDILNASLDENCETASNRECANYNYLMPKQTTYWTLTPSTENSYTAYKISTSSNPPILLSKTNSSSTMKFV